MRLERLPFRDKMDYRAKRLWLTALAHLSRRPVRADLAHQARRACPAVRVGEVAMAHLECLVAREAQAVRAGRY